MKIAALNSSLKASRVNAEQHLPALTLQYERLIRQASREAATTLVATSQTMAVTSAATPNWQIPPEGILFAITTLTQRATRRLSKLHRQIVTATAKPPLVRAGIAWDITHPLSKALLEATGARTGERLGNTIRPVLQDTLAVAYAEGLSVDDAADLIRTKFVEAAPGQADMLARTDLNSLSNGGSVMAAQMVGVTTKEWLTAEDDKVRETHADADGQQVPIDQPFDVGGEQLDYPGDPAGSDDEVCNCRCSVVYSDPDVGEPDDMPEGETASAGARIPSRDFAVFAPPPPPILHRKGFARSVPPVTAAASSGWVSDLAFEGMATEDGRYILPGALTWRELPLSLGAMFDTPHADMVMAAPVVGRIDQIEKADMDMAGEPMAAGVTAIRGYGVFDLAGEHGGNVARLVADETMRGVSVDLAVDDWCFRNPETGELIEPDDASDSEMEDAMFGELQYAVRAGSIMAATVCPTPAFADARIAMVASADGRKVVRLWAPFRMEGAESLTASAAPPKPPADWFYRDEPNAATPLTVTDDGQVYGHVAAWGSCHTGRLGVCLSPPRSQSAYAYFNIGEIACADGKRVPCGQIFFHGEHAPLSMTAQRVKDHYAHTGLVGADVRAVDGRHGIWVSGALRSTLTVEQAREFMAAKPSGDWRQMRPGGPLELTSVLAVNDPGFPVPRAVVASADTDEVVALIASFNGADDEDATDRTLRVLFARAEGREALLDLAGV